MRTLMLNVGTEFNRQRGLQVGRGQSLPGTLP